MEQNFLGLLNLMYFFDPLNPASIPHVKHLLYWTGFFRAIAIVKLLVSDDFSAIVVEGTKYYNKNSR